MGLIMWIFFALIFGGLALVAAYVIACVTIGLYNVVKMILGTIYADWCEMRLGMARVGAEMRAQREFAKTGAPLPDASTNEPGGMSTSVRQPAVAEALGHIIRHPSMDGLTTGVDNNTVTRFNRK